MTNLPISFTLAILLIFGIGCLLGVLVFIVDGLIKLSCDIASLR